MRHRPYLLLVLFLSATRLSAAGAAPAAQSTLADTVIHGLVLDATHAPIASAQITADAGVAGATVSSPSGTFTLSLPPGHHQLTISAPGFRPLHQTVDAGARTVVEHVFTLAVDAVHESVTVTGIAEGYQRNAVRSATKTDTALLDVPQSVTVITSALIQDQLMDSVADVVRYVPGMSAHQGENNRDQVIIRGNSSSADFFVDGVRDDLQYFRDLYNVERVEALKGPNAMVFGRGGGGGVINRVTKVAGFASENELSLLLGAFGDTRATLDVNRRLNGRAAFRVNGLYQEADSFRDSVTHTRAGINPTLTLAPTPRTQVTVGLEHVIDRRVADRGIPSFAGRPLDTSISTYFGDPDSSFAKSRADVGALSVSYQRGATTLRHRTLLGDYDRRYQNYVPGAVDAQRTSVALTAYNNSTARRNAFSQTDLIIDASQGRLPHTLLAGIELGRQRSDNLRQTGYFNDTATSTLAPLLRPSVVTPATFRPSPIDANNHVVAQIAAAYVQEQLHLTKTVQLVGGVRVDRFHLAYRDNRTAARLGRTDTILSPRAGVVVKLRPALATYGSYTVSSLPSAGDQFASLTLITEQLRPERFTNLEWGVKWDARPDLSLTAAAYRLNRTNTRATDPTDPTRIVQTGAQRTDGYELGVNGHVTAAWRLAGGYAWQDARITSATAAARIGARVAQVPRHSLSLWNAYQIHPRFEAALGLVRRTDMYAAIDNTVVLPGYTTVDLAVFTRLTPRIRLQGNVDNVTNRRYYLNADGNTNISPGAPRTLRVATVVTF